MSKYIKLGKKAEVFYDPYSGVLLAKRDVIKLQGKGLRSDKVRKAINSGHLALSSETEYKKAKGSDVVELNKDVTTEFDEIDETLGGQFDGLEKSELVDFLEENYEIDDEEVVKFKKLTRAKMVKYLLALVGED